MIQIQIPPQIVETLSGCVTSVFIPRPTLLPSVPVISCCSNPSRVVGSASLSLIEGKSLGVASIELLPPLTALHIYPVCGSSEASPNTGLVQLLSRLVTPRSVLHLPTPQPLTEDDQSLRFVCVLPASINSTINIDGQELDVQDLVESSLKPWCAEVEAALAAGRRFAPILRSSWTWQQSPSPTDDTSASSRLHFNQTEAEVAPTAAAEVDVVIPLGTGCSSAVACRTGDLRSDGLPFDWVLSSLGATCDIVSRCLKQEEFSLPFDKDREDVKPVWHVRNSNRYVSEKRKDNDELDEASAPASHLFDTQSGIVASRPEAERFRRRTERLRAILAERVVAVVTEGESLFCCMYIGRPHSEAEMLVVDGQPAAAEDAEEDSGQVLLRAVDKLAASLSTTKSKARCIFFAFNCVQYDFTKLFDNGCVLLLHRFVGFADPSASWDSIGHVIGRLLPSTKLLRVKESIKHADLE